MPKNIFILFIAIGIICSAGCSKAYKVAPLPFKAPDSLNNAVKVEGAIVAARAFVDKDEAKKAFGFDIRGAGMLPVQVIFDNKGPHSFGIDGQQTFLEDEDGNLWQILSSNIAYERAAKYAKTGKMVKEGTLYGAMGAVAGSIIGAAIGIVSGENVGVAAGKGAALGGAAGLTIGGASGYASDDARKSVVTDLQQKSLQNKVIGPDTLAYGILFFPGESNSVKQLRLRLVERDTDKFHVIYLNF